MKTNNNFDKVQKMSPMHLENDLDPLEKAELGNLEGLESYLAQFTAPEPTKASQEQLLKTLNPSFASPRPRAGTPNSYGLKRWLRLIVAQLDIIDIPFWWACALIFCLGLAVAIIHPDQVLPALFTLFAPLVAASGVAYAFRPATQTLGELEKATPIPVLALFYVRFVLVMAFIGLLSLGLIVVLWLNSPQVVLWRLLIVWIGPMLALAGMAMYVTVRWGSLHGLIVPILLWTGIVFLRFSLADQTGLKYGSALTSYFTQINHSNPLLAASVMAALLGIMLATKAGKRAERRAQ
jgi:hypothetical protein